MNTSALLRLSALLMCLCILGMSVLGCTPSEPSVDPNEPSTPAEDGGTDPTLPDDPPAAPTTPGSDIDEPPTTEQPTTATTQNKITDYLTLHGRTYISNNALQLYWTYSGFSINILGTGLQAELTTSNTHADSIGSLCVYVDGALAPANTVTLTENGTYTLVSDLPRGKHTIEIRKRNEAVYGGSATIGVKSLSVTDGVFCTKAPQAPDLKIAFVGDSITGGFGNMVTDGSGEKFTTSTQDGTMTYATLTGRALNADVEIISRSGIAFVQNTDKACFYDHYSRTASLPGNVACADEWDFETNGANIVIINLGTNDSGAKMDGQTISDSYMTEQAVAFLRMVRENNPNALIIWTYGLMGNGRRAALEAAVKQLNDEGDYDFYYIPLTPQNTAANGVGVHGHPTVQTHILAAEELSTVIAALIGADVDSTVFLEAQLRCYEEYRLSASTAYEDDSYAAYLEAAATAKNVLSSDFIDTDAVALATLRQAFAALTLKKVIAPEEISNEYIVIDTCDEQGTWTFTGTVSSGIDTENQIAGAGCFTSTGGNAKYAVNFMNTGNPYNITLPENWQEWYLEMWIYIDNPSTMSSSGDIEISQVVDVDEFSFSMPALNLKEGWNHLQLRIGDARRGSAGWTNLTTIRNIRLFWVNLTDTLTFKVDDIVISKGKYAADTAELRAMIAEAEAVTAPSAVLTEALAFAKQANSQRHVDIAVQRLEHALALAE